MRKTTKKKTIVATAFLTTLMMFGAFIPIFWFKNNASPLDKWIEVSIFCAETEEPVPDGLAIRLVGQGYDMTERTKAGTALFGSGLVDGTYTISWYWNGEYFKEVTIDCSKITWHFDYYVPNPTITKHFKYKTPYNNYPPIIGLDVSLYEDDVFIISLKTDETGTVFFGGLYIDVSKDYYLTWVWGGEPAQVGPIHFAYDADGKLQVCAWEETNFLEPKSGGGK